MSHPSMKYIDNALKAEKERRRAVGKRMRPFRRSTAQEFKESQAEIAAYLAREPTRRNY